MSSIVSSHAALSSDPEPRGGRRHKVFLPAEMATPDGPMRVHLLNISATGALVHSDTLPERGAVVQFSCGPSTWLARVVWARHKRFGVVHVTPLTPTAIDTLVIGQRG